MFTGIIENTGILRNIIKLGTNKTFVFESPFCNELKVDQSLSHNGVCLTIEKINIDTSEYEVTAIEETLQKTNLNNLKVSDLANLERCMKADGRFDGHIVQGHVDQTGTIKSIVDKNGSWEITITYDDTLGNITVEKGSVCVNGISLTVVNSQKNQFSLAIIPYTWNYTNLKNAKVGELVNLEFDILGKYISKILSNKN